METDADRLASIQALGGQLVHSSYASFWAIFDREFSLSPDGAVESRQPALQARASDVDGMPKDTVVRIGAESFKVKRHEPDGTGMTLVILRR